MRCINRSEGQPWCNSRIIPSAVKHLAANVDHRVVVSSKPSFFPRNRAVVGYFYRATFATFSRARSITFCVVWLSHRAPLIIETSGKCEYVCGTHEKDPVFRNIINIRKLIHDWKERQPWRKSRILLSPFVKYYCLKCL